MGIGKALCIVYKARAQTEFKLCDVTQKGSLAEFIRIIKSIFKLVCKKNHCYVLIDQFKNFDLRFHTYDIQYFVIELFHASVLLVIGVLFWSRHELLVVGVLFWLRHVLLVTGEL